MAVTAAQTETETPQEKLLTCWSRSLPTYLRVMTRRQSHDDVIGHVNANN